MTAGFIGDTYLTSTVSLQGALGFLTSITTVLVAFVDAIVTSFYFMLNAPLVCGTPLLESILSARLCKLVMGLLLRRLVRWNEFMTVFLKSRETVVLAWPLGKGFSSRFWSVGYN